MSKKGNEDSLHTVSFPLHENANAYAPQDSLPFKSATIGITYPRPNYHIHKKESKITLFEYILEGEGEVMIEGKWKKVVAGEFYILPAGIEHRYHCSNKNPWKKIWINYDAEYMGALLSAYGIKGDVYKAPEAKMYFEEIYGLKEYAKDRNR